MKRNITKLNDYVYSNIQNVWVILNYFWSYIVDERELDSFLNLLRINKFQFSIDFLKYKDTKKYFIEVWNGRRWDFNNSLSINKNFDTSKFFFTTKLHELTNHSFLKDRVIPEKEFVLFNNNLLNQKFKEDFIDKNLNAEEKKELYMDVLTNNLSYFLKSLGTGKNKEFDSLVLQEKIKSMNEKKVGFTSDSSQTVDAIIWEEMFNFFVSTEFVLPYFISFEDKITPSNKSWGKYMDRSWEIDIVSFIKFLDETIKLDKYFLRFSFDYDTSWEITYVEDWKAIRLKSESSTYNSIGSELWGFTTSLFIFQEQPDLGEFARNLINSFPSAQILNPDSSIECSPFYITDNSYLWKNYIPKENIKDVFGMCKKYEYNPTGLIFWREYYSNIPLKFYPHVKAGLDERWMLEKGAHAWYCWATGTWKSQLAINTWKQLWNDNTYGYYIDNIGWLTERIRFYNKNLKFSTYTWWMDRYWNKLDILSKKVGLRETINEYRWKIRELEKDYSSKKKEASTDKEELTKLMDEIQKLNWKVNSLIPISERLDTYISSYINESVDNIDFKVFIDWYKEFVKDITNESIKSFITERIVKTERDISFIDKLKTPYKEVNFIWKIWFLQSKWVDEISTKTDVLSSLLDIDIIENKSLKEALLSIIKEYFQSIKYGEFFIWNDFEKYYNQTIDGMDISSLDRKTAKGKILLGSNFKNLLNSKVDIIEYLNEINLWILDISSLSASTEKNKKMLRNFFLILTLFAQFPLSSWWVKYFFLEEFHNYLTEIDTASMYLKVAVWKLIKESRNWNCIFYLITQLYSDFKKSDVIDNLSQFVILDENNIKLFAEDSFLKWSAIYQKYKDDYVKLAESLSKETKIDASLFWEKKNWRLWFFYNKLSMKWDWCFITKINLKDFDLFN